MHYSITMYHIMSEMQEVYANRMDPIEELYGINGNGIFVIKSFYKMRKSDWRCLTQKNEWVIEVIMMKS